MKAPISKKAQRLATVLLQGYCENNGLPCAMSMDVDVYLRLNKTTTEWEKAVNAAEHILEELEKPVTDVENYLPYEETNGI